MNCERDVRTTISEWKERTGKWDRHRRWDDTCDSRRMEGLTRGGKAVVVAHIPSHKATKDGSDRPMGSG